MKSLKNKKVIDSLFTDKASRSNTSMIRSRFIKGESEVMISVPKKIFKKAVDRNRIKRMMRESIRTKKNLGFTIAFIYNSENIESFEKIDNDIKKIFENIK